MKKAGAVLIMLLALLSICASSSGAQAGPTFTIFSPAGCNVCEEQASVLRQQFGDAAVNTCPLEDATCNQIMNSIYELLLQEYGQSRHIPFVIIRSSKGLVAAVVVGPQHPEAWTKLAADVEQLSQNQILLIKPGADAIVLAELDAGMRRAVEEAAAYRPEAAATQQLQPLALPPQATSSEYMLSNAGFVILAVIALIALMFSSEGDSEKPANN
ncbi:MAG: hypothetical protein QXG25_02255 [Nitrososphaerota archaeon]